MEHGGYDSHSTMLSGCEAYIEETPVGRVPEADRVRLPAKQYVDQAYTAQDPRRGAGPVKAGRKKGQETDDEMSELESSDNRKTNNDTTRQRGRPRLDTRDESQAEVSYLTPLLLLAIVLIFFKRRRTQIRLAQRAYRLRKETTIASLRSRVSELESAIEGMKDAFVELRHASAAMADSNDHTVPAFLESVSARFFTLAKTASEGNISCDEDADAYVADQSGEEMISSSRRPRSQTQR